LDKMDKLAKHIESELSHSKQSIEEIFADELLFIDEVDKHCL